MTDEHDCRDGCNGVQRRVQYEHRPEPAGVRAEDALRDRGGNAEICEARRGRGCARAEDRRVVYYRGDRGGREAERGHGVAEGVVDDRRADREGERAAEETDELPVVDHEIKNLQYVGYGRVWGADRTHVPDGGDDRHVASRYARLRGDCGGLQSLEGRCVSVSPNRKLTKGD